MVVFRTHHRSPKRSTRVFRHRTEESRAATARANQAEEEIMRPQLDLQRSRWIAATSVTFILLAGLVGGSRAHAQSAEAEGLFNDGNKLMAEGQLVQACDAFEASNHVEPRAGTLIRLGECREQNQQLASAWSAYKDALTRVKDPRKREVASAKAKAKALEARLSYLTVSVSDENRIEGMTLMRNSKPFDPTLWNRALPVDGGDYLIAGRAPGHEAWQTSAHVPAEGGKVSVEVPKLKELSNLTAPPTTPPVPPTTPPVPPSVTERQRSTGQVTTRRKFALGVAVTSVLGVVTGVVLGVSANGKQNDAFKLCPDPATPCTQADQSNALLKSAHSRALEANVAFGIAAAAAIGAAVLWLTGAPDAENPRRVSVIPSGTGVIVMGRF
jgi:hypothetical protein